MCLGLCTCVSVRASACLCVSACPCTSVCMCSACVCTSAPVCVDGLFSLPLLLPPLPFWPGLWAYMAAQWAQDPLQCADPQPSLQPLSLALHLPPIHPGQQAAGQHSALGRVHPCSDASASLQSSGPPSLPLGRWDSGQGHPGPCCCPSLSQILRLHSRRKLRAPLQVKGLLSVGPSGSLRPLMKS